MAGEMFIEPLDDEVQFEVSNDFSGGMLSNARPILLRPNQAVNLTNIDISLAGEATTRRGSVGLGTIVGGVSNASGIQGMFWYSTSTDEYLVAANNGKLYKWNGASWTAIAATWTNSDITKTIHFDQLSTKLYFCNGTVNLFSFDGTTTTDLGNAANNQPPPLPGLVCEHTNRLVVVGSGTNRNSLFFSQFLDGTLYDKARWSLQVGDSNDSIVAIKSWSGFNLLVFKRHSVWVINCDPSLQLQDIDGTIQFFEVKPIHQQIGCIAPLTVQQVGNDVFFLSHHGVYSINKILSGGSDQEIGPDLSYPVHDYIDRISTSSAGNSAAIGYGNKYILSFGIDTSTFNNTMLVWNDTLKIWAGIWNGWNASCFAYCSPVSGNLLRFGTCTGGGLVKEWLDYVKLTDEIASTYKDDAAEIPSIVTTKSYTFGGISNLKTPWVVRSDWFNSLSTVELYALLDRHGGIDLGSIPGGGGQGIVFPLAFPVLFPAIKSFPSSSFLQRYGQFSEIKFKFSSVAKKMNLISVAAGAWGDTLDTSGVNIQPPPA